MLLSCAVDELQTALSYNGTLSDDEPLGAFTLYPVVRRYGRSDSLFLSPLPPLLLLLSSPALMFSSARSRLWHGRFFQLRWRDDNDALDRSITDVLLFFVCENGFRFDCCLRDRHDKFNLRLSWREDSIDLTSSPLKTYIILFHTSYRLWHNSCNPEIIC